MLIIEMPHPGDMFDGSMISPEVLGGERWESDDGSGPENPLGRVEVQWGDKKDDFNPQTQVLTRSVKIEAKGSERRTRTDQVRQRYYTVGEFELMAAASGLRIAGLFGEAELGTGLFDEQAYRMFVVLRHAGAPDPPAADAADAADA